MRSLLVMLISYHRLELVSRQNFLKPLDQPVHSTVDQTRDIGEKENPAEHTGENEQNRCHGISSIDRIVESLETESYLDVTRRSIAHQLDD